MRASFLLFASAIALLTAGSLTLVGCTETPVENVASPSAIVADEASEVLDAQPVALVTAQGGWTRFRGADGSGVSQAANLPTTWSDAENLLWKAKLPGPGTSSPIVVGDRVYVTCHTGYGIDEQNPGRMEDLVRHLVCLDAAEGNVLWQRDVPAEQPETEFSNRMFWHGYASSTPAADDERVYVFFGKSGVLAFDHEGNRQWQTSVGKKTHEWGSAASVALYENLVIVNAFVECGQLVALDKETGKEVWRAGELAESWNTPALVKLPDGKTELVVGVMGKVLGFDPATGDELWTCDAVNWYIVGSIVSHDGVVYCIAGRDHGSVAVRAGGRGDVSETHVAWRSQKGSNVSSPLYFDGHLYFAHESNAVSYCLDAKDGEVVYEERLPGRGSEVYASPVVADGKLIYVRRQGGAHVLPAAPRFEELATNVFESDETPFNGSPAVEAGRIYLRSNATLYCVGAR